MVSSYNLVAISTIWSIYNVNFQNYQFYSKTNKSGTFMTGNWIYLQYSSNIVASGGIVSLIALTPCSTVRDASNSYFASFIFSISTGVYWSGFIRGKVQVYPLM